MVNEEPEYIEGNHKCSCDCGCDAIVETRMTKCINCWSEHK